MTQVPTRIQGLTLVKRLATGLPIPWAIIQVVSAYFELSCQWTGYLNATSEAAMLLVIAEQVAAGLVSAAINELIAALKHSEGIREEEVTIDEERVGAPAMIEFTDA